MFGMSVTRSVMLQAYLPRLIIGLMVGAAILSGLLAGYAMAKRRTRSWFHLTVHAALLALTIFTVLDLDRPRFGIVNIDAAYRPLIELRDAMKDIR
jgi:hypothetical protein